MTSRPVSPSDGADTGGTPAASCSRCLRPVPPGYRLRGGELRCRRHVLGHPSVYRRSLITALIVGTILTAINQGNRILDSGVTLEILIKMCLTYCVPFCVSTLGALGATRILPPPTNKPTDLRSG